jgi:hypothetical protein
MSTDVPIRIVALVAVLLAAAAAAFALLVLGHSRAKPGAPAASKTPVAKTPAAKPPAVHQKAPAAPRLTPGLPAPIAFALTRHPAVVVALYGRGAADRGAVAEARAGASLAHVNFIALDVMKRRYADAMAAFAGSLAEPAVIVVRRPGTIVRRFDGVQDRQVVAQAAHDVR